MSVGGGEIPLNPNAKKLFLESLEGYKRILILGGSGWFGRTAISMLGRKSGESLVLGSRERRIIVGNHEIPIRTWSKSLVQQYEPDLVMDFAFLTRDLEVTLGAKKFRAINNVLSTRLLGLSRMVSVRKMLTISSGAAMVSKLGPESSTLDLYGQQKLATERSLKEVAGAGGTEVAVARAWSVSGGHVQKPGNYAFSDMIHSALKLGTISITAKNLVTRRYCSVEDFLAVVMASSRGMGWAAIDSGGPLVELGELAQAVAREVEGCELSADITARGFGVADVYHSDNSTWVAACESAGLEPLTLDEQIRNVRDSLR